MQRLFVAALICAVGLTFDAALAQPSLDRPPREATVAPVTVEAAAPPKVIRRQANSFVQSYAAAPNPNIDQISRWHEPVCAEVWGLPLAEQAAKIKARIESTAQSLRLPATRPGCKINLEIVFTDKPQALMDTVAKSWEPLLGYYHRYKTAQLKTVTHPIQAWYVTGTESDGVNVADLMDKLTVRNLLPPFNRITDDPATSPPAGCLNRFTACYFSEFRNVLIVADSKALDGRNLRLVADDMAMLALSQPRSLDGCNALPSVIDSFAKSPCPGRDPPDSLTPADRAYLSALYSADPEGKKFVEYAAIGERMGDILVEQSAGGGAGAGPPTAAVKVP